MNNPLAKIEKESWYLEPAAFYVVCYSGDSRNERYLPSDVKKKNPALHWFNEGIRSYFKIWTSRKYISKEIEKYYDFKYIEDAFLTSLLYSAFSDERTINLLLSNFIKGNILNKIAVANRIMKGLLELPHGNPKSKKPANPYNRRLVAAWSSTWLTNHYWESQRINIYKYEPLKDIVNELIEVPLRNMGIRIRSKENEAKYLTSYI